MTAQQSSALVAPQTNNEFNVFGSIESFEAAQRMVKVFSNSNLVPSTFKGDIGACLIAMNMANRMGADILQVMQSLYIVHGKPSFSSAFLIACFNRSGRFSTIRYIFTGEPNTDQWGCKAETTELGTGEVITGVNVTIAMAKAEGWYNKTGSKWKTMPELMLQYRSATFLIRTTAPEIALGFQTTEEWRDVVDITSQSQVMNGTPSLEEIAMQAVAEDAPTEAAPEEPAPEKTTTPVEEAQPKKGKDFTTQFFENHKKDEQ